MDTATLELLNLALLSKYTFRLRPVNRLTLPKFRGAPFRGGFGRALLEAVCPEKACRQSYCPHRLQCAYSYIFETPVPDNAEVLRLNTNVTHPFIIELPYDSRDVYGIEDVLELHLILIGKAIDYLPYCIFALERLGMMGMGKERQKYFIENVVAMDNGIETLVFSGREKRFSGKGSQISFAGIITGRDSNMQRWKDMWSVEVRFITPGRFEYDGKVMTKELEFHVLFRSILRRLSTLLYFHCNKVKLPIDYKQLIEDAKGITIAKSDLVWDDYERYSTRKEKWMKLGGFSGSICYHGDLEPFIPFLLIAEYIHAGKSVSFGFGQITLH